MKKFTKIRKYCDVVEKIRSNWDYTGRDENNQPIYAHNSPYPTIKYTGTVKLHGSNAGVEISDNGQVSFQSRYSIVDATNDEINFYNFATQVDWLKYFGGLAGFTIYGEWCNSDPSNITAIHKAGPIFVIIAIRSRLTNDYLSVRHIQELSKTKLKQLNAQNVWFISQFPTYSVTIDFNNPDDVTSYIDGRTAEVGIECPVAKQLGVTGSGEGIVWEPESGYESGLVFKTKSKEHLVALHSLPTTADIVKASTITEFVNNTCTRNRLQQGIRVLIEQGIPLIRANTGVYVAWVVNDILDEEASLLAASGLCKKDVARKLGAIAKRYWEQK